MSAQFVADTDAELRARYESLTNVIRNIEYEATQRKAEWAEVCLTDLTTEEYQEERARYYRWKADAETLKRDARRTRGLVSEEMKRRVDQDNGASEASYGLRLPLYKLAVGIERFQRDDEMMEEELFDMLDTLKVFAGGQAWTLREFLRNGARW